MTALHLRRGRLLAAAFGLLSSPGALASMDWTDFCAPDRAALVQAGRDFPSDRFDRSTCSDAVYRRGTCEVRPALGGRNDQQARFRVLLRNNQGAERVYDVLMEQAPAAEAEHPGAVCRIRSARLIRPQAGSAGEGGGSR